MEIGRRLASGWRMGRRKRSRGEVGRRETEGEEKEGSEELARNEGGLNVRVIRRERTEKG